LLRRIYGPNREEVTGWRKLHNEELHNLFSSRDIITVIKLKGVRSQGIRALHVGQIVVFDSHFVTVDYVGGWGGDLPMRMRLTRIPIGDDRRILQHKAQKRVYSDYAYVLWFGPLKCVLNLYLD
jgi:hypothetical protein